MTPLDDIDGSSTREVAQAVEAFAQPAILLDHEYRILAANRAYCTTFGGAPEGKRCYEVSHHYRVPCDQAGETCPLRDALASGEARRVLHLHHTARGEEHVDVELHPIRDRDGKVRYFIEQMRFVRVAGATPSEDRMVGRSPQFNRMLGLIHRVAHSETAVLLLGESGTGKELAAQAVHEASPRRDRPFVPVDCSGLTETLFESELFGHEKGAFTGAARRKIGLVEAAAGGTLFLDELGDIPLAQQVKLLRLLETGTFRRVGGVEPLQADFRLVCATHRNLKQMVAEERFRRDLYYRINAFPILLPSLSERREDLPLLIESQLKRLGSGRTLHFTDETMAILERYPFPGNIRELRNVVERALLVADGERVLPEHLPEELREAAAESDPQAAFELMPLAAMERRYLTWAARRFPGDRKALADALGLSERTLYRKLQGIAQ
ncbi:sigma-54 interaction domain-containing protein [Endothiovibrio diazotrophicus]